MWSRATKRRAGVALLALVVVLGLYLMAQRLIEPADGATTSTRAEHGRISKQEKIGLSIKAVGLYLDGKEKRARKVLVKAYGKRYWRKIKVRQKRPRLRVSTTYEHGRGRCTDFEFRSVLEWSLLGTDILRSYMSQRWCWKHGHITRLSKARIDQEVTDYGLAINYQEDGVTQESSGWTDFGGKRHGGHYTNKISHFVACAPIPTGCILPNRQSDRMSLVVHAGGGVDSDT